MAQAKNFDQSMYFVEEVTAGTTPSTPTMIEIPIAGNPTLAVEKDSSSSKRIGNRNVTHHRHGVRKTSGEIPVELAYGDFDPLFESVMNSTWASNVLKVGTVQKFFTLERRFAGISEFQPFTGCAMNTFSLTAAPNGMIDANFGVIGFGGMTPASATAASTSTATSGNSPFDGFSGSITEGGASATITSIDFSLTNNAALTHVIGSDTAANMNLGMFGATGNITALFESEVLVNKFLNETESALTVTFEGIDGGDLQFDFSSVKYSGATITEADEGLLVNMPWTAVNNVSVASSMVITRTPA